MAKKIILIVLLVLGSSSFSFSQQNIGDNMNFNISTNFLYYPGEKPVVNIAAHNYFKEGTIDVKNYEFDFTIYKIRDVEEFFVKQKNKNTIDIEGTDTTNLIYLTDEVYSFHKTYKPKHEYGYIYFQDDFPLSLNENGAYLVKASYKNKVAYCGLIISKLGVVTKIGANTILAQIVDKKTGEAIPSAILNFYLSGKKVTSGISKEGGIFYSEFENTGNSNDAMLVGHTSDDVIISDPYTYYNSNLRNVVYTYTNQPVYRTDSDVKFKSIIREKKVSGYEPIANKNINVKVNDSRGNKIYESQYTTNGNGSIDGSFHLDKEAPLGNYNIYVYITEKEYYTFAFSVEQYKKPEYEVSVNADKMQYYGKDIINGSVNSKYYFGSPVTDAEVTYEIYRQTYYVPWWKFSDYSWWYEDFEDNLSNYGNSERELIYTGKGKTDSEGNFDFSYNINEDFKLKNYRYIWWGGDDYKTDMLYTVYARVVDKSRREIDGSKSVYVTRGGYYLNAKLDKYIYKPNERANLEVNARNYNDAPVIADFEAKIMRTNYRNQDKYTSDYIKTVKGSTRADGKGIVSFDIDKDFKEGAYNIEIVSKDDRQNIITTSTYFYVYERDISWWHIDESQSIQIITDKDSYKKGEVCKTLIILQKPVSNILIAAQTDDVVFYKVVNALNGTAEVEIPITDNINTNMTITASYVSEFVFNNNSKNVVIIPEDKFLTVELTPSREIYKPKETGEVKVRVLDYKGSPISNAEISLGVIDESIYAIHKENAKDIRKAFYSSQYNYIYTTFNNKNVNYGNSRLQTIYERFNIKKMSESELGTVKGTLKTKDEKPIPNAEIVIDEEYLATTTNDEGEFEFMLPEGQYELGVQNGDEILKIKEISVKKKNVEVINAELENFIAQNNDLSRRGGRVNDKLIVTESIAPESEKKPEIKQLEKEENLISPEVRSDFKDAIVWMPYVTTDENGYATVEVNYPDNLTQWRMTARVITSDSKVGEKFIKVITRKNLLVRMETPRFLQSGDNVTITTIVHNYLDSEKKVTVRFKADGVELTGDNEKTLTLGKNMDEKIDWNINVTNASGDAKLYCEALTNEESDAVEMKVPMQPKGLKVTNSIVSDLDNDNQTELKIFSVPSYIDMRLSKYSFTISPSISSTLLTSLDELIGYPYGCIEQTMSRFLPSIIVANAYKELNVPINENSKNILPKVVKAGLDRIYSFQHPDGGWGWWFNDMSQAYMTAYVVYGLNIAKASGYDVKPTVISKGTKAMKNLYINNIDDVTKAYMLYVLSSSKEKDFVQKEIGILELGNSNSYSLALLALTYYNLGEKEDAARLVDKLESSYKTFTDDIVYWESEGNSYDWRNDKVQTTSTVLKALVNIKPSSNLIDKTVRWLMQQRQGYAWRSTQETASIVYSMVDYLKISKELDPDFSANIYLNDQLYYTKTFSKDDIYNKDSVINISYDKLKEGENKIKIEKNGKGKLYYSSQFIYFDNSDNIVSSETGFRLEKEYYKLEQYKHYNDDKIDYKKQYFDGNVKSGDLIFVKVKVYSKDKGLNYFMLEDPLPAGCEVIKDDWSIKVQDEKDFNGYDYYYWRWWYADKDIRDDKMVFFATYLYGDEFEFTYILRAQIPGEYTINPSNAVLMYYPEYKGNTKGYTLKISDK